MWLFYLSILFLHNFSGKFLFQFQENGNVFFLLIALLLLLFLHPLFVFIFPLEQIRLLFLFAFILSILYLFNLEKVKFSFVVEKMELSFFRLIRCWLSWTFFLLYFYIFRLLYNELFFISCKYVKSKMVSKEWQVQIFAQNNC